MKSKCDYCSKPAVVQINSRAACGDHIDQSMGAAFAPLQALREEANRDTADE